jgi:hypothetical protein
MRRSAIAIILALLSSSAVAADPVANEVCLACHGGVQAGNPASPHLKAPVRCESCHGDGARHAETGDPKLIRSFKGKPAAEVCTTCHQDQHVAEWKASRHHEVGIDCADCHTAHLQSDPKDSCKRCH